MNNLRASVPSDSLEKDEKWVFAFKRSLWALHCTLHTAEFKYTTEKSPGTNPQLEARVSEKARAPLAATGAIRLWKRTLADRNTDARARKVASMYGMAAVVWVDN